MSCGSCSSAAVVSLPMALHVAGTNMAGEPCQLDKCHKHISLSWHAERVVGT